MDVDFSNGEVQALQLGKQQLTDAEEMIAKLSAVVQTQAGMFEFRIHPVASVPRNQPVMVNRLVMSLVYYVDEQLKQRSAIAPTHWYIAEAFRPDVWMEPSSMPFISRPRPISSPVCMSTNSRNGSTIPSPKRIKNWAASASSVSSA